jgi:hypothetical protein
MKLLRGRLKFGKKYKPNKTNYSYDKEISQEILYRICSQGME